MIRKRKTRRKLNHSRFLGMSKILGVFILLALAWITVYAMVEMHEQNNLESLPQLLISVFGIGAVYIGFYLTMAKWEHIEEEKTLREKELLKLKKSLNMMDTQEDIEKLEKEIDDLEEKCSEIEQEEIKPE